ncbi:unnamed protein product [Lepeophtheirus salmonis]|uniref:(salmon louse) hypothetical protein n=1 Tax=Lepeophtheirus salmonis TaxID=72036 RepID=A0A7R8CHI9_LEPSM|nr:unnamed protein product [Lepeophtheirus salmonis]CAF2768101.1 unnamed protein product [Lepeophtheirus salmonis]
MELTKNALLSPCPDDTALTASIKQKMCWVLNEKYKSPVIQVLLRNATILEARYSGPEESREGAIRESGSNTAGGNVDEHTATAPTKKMKLSYLQNRRAHLASKTLAPDRVQGDTMLTQFIQEDTLDAVCDPLMWWCNN